MKEFGARLREERINLGLTQVSFASVGQVEINAQGKYERGTRCPRADYLMRLSKVGVDISYLFYAERLPIRPELLAGAETEIVRLYRLLTNDDRQAVVILLHSLAASLNTDEV